MQKSLYNFTDSKKIILLTIPVVSLVNVKKHL